LIGRLRTFLELKMKQKNYGTGELHDDCPHPPPPHPAEKGEVVKTESRHCYMCDEFYPPTEFYKDGNRLGRRCRRCHNSRKNRITPTYREKARRHRLKYPERAKAYSLLALAIKRGEIRKPKKCEECEMLRVKVQGHHNDYEKPLEVIWLCHTCHMKKHGRWREAA
jgi:hypothetical protein